jgi:hypothetical protein
MRERDLAKSAPWAKGHQANLVRQRRGLPPARVLQVVARKVWSALAVATDGLPLGSAAIKFQNRQKFKGTAALKRKFNPTRLPIEQKESFRWLKNMRQSIALFDAPKRCIHVGDREGDIYELFSLVEELGTHFLVRTSTG